MTKEINDFVSFFPNFLEYIRANNYFIKDKFDRFIANIKRCRFF